MAAYVIVNVDVTDPETYEEYRKLVPATLAAYGGKFLARGGKNEKWEGDYQPKRLVILEFESSEMARRWYESEEYRQPKELRWKASTADMILVEGV